MANTTITVMDEKERAGWAAATKTVVPEVRQLPPLPPEIVQDFEDARENIETISQVAMKAIEDAALLASQAQNDKMYAALASLIRATNETQRDKMDLHSRKKALMPREEGPKQVTNQLIMTSADVLKMLKGGDK